jgi:hypothetical protein
VTRKDSADLLGIAPVMKIFHTTGSVCLKTPAMTFIEINAGKLGGREAGKQAGLDSRPLAFNQLNQLNQPINL